MTHKLVPRPKRQSPLATTLRSFGPGIVTGAADDDPSGIATYSKVGAELGYGILWTALFSVPLMVAVQQITASIGRVTGHGVAHHMRRSLPMPVGIFLVVAVGVANVINIGADAAAMGAAARMLLGGPTFLYSSILVAICLGLQIFVPYARYANILKWSTLVLFAYVVAPFAVEVSWRDVLHGTLLPTGLFDGKQWTALTAVLGTTISPYLIFWQASQEAEEITAHKKKKALRQMRDHWNRELHRINADTWVGMIASNLIAFSIMLTCAAALHAHGVTNVGTTEEVATALRPVAGSFAFGLFALGIVGTGLLAIPVLAGSVAYAIGDLFEWRSSLEARWDQAKPFYATLAAVTLAGLAIAAAPVSPIQALYWSAVVNGIAAVPVIVATVWIATSPRVMGKRFAVRGPRRALGWLTAAIMLAMAAGTIVELGG